MASNPEPVCLRLLEPADAANLLDFYKTNREFLRPWEPLRPPDFFTLEAMQNIIAACQAEAAQDLTYSYGIWVGHPGELAGRITLTGLARGVSQSANLGYALAERQTGRGYASTAVRRMLAVAFGQLGLHRVAAASLTYNHASIRVLRACGFRQEGLARRYLQINGEWQDHFLFAITAEEVG